MIVIRATAGPFALLCKFEKEVSFFQVDAASCQSIQFGKQNVGWISGALSLSAGFPCAIPGAAFSVSSGWVLLGVGFHYTSVGAADAVGAWLYSLSHWGFLRFQGQISVSAKTSYLKLLFLSA